MAGFLLAILIATVATCRPAQAGLSSENVVVVVNGDSPVSRTVANHYIAFRDIPTHNVIVLREVPEGTRVELAVFRDKILRPLLEQIDARGIANQVRVIAYSADFPTAVGVAEHHAQIEDPNVKKYQKPIAAITGLTFFYKFVLADKGDYLNFGSNLYARGRFDRHFINPFSDDSKEQYDKAVTLLKEEKFAESAEIWQQLVDAHESLPALAIRAAEAYSLSEQDVKAVEMIRAAIKRGWWSATYLKQTACLDRLLSDSQLAKVLPYLDESPIAWQGPEPFSSSVGWNLAGHRMPLKQGGVPYLCSCALAVVEPRGNTLDQAVEVLRRASRCDRTFPAGRFAFGANSNVRAKTRFAGIADAMVYLQENQFETEVFSDRLPDDEGAIVGMMVGAPNVTLSPSRWQLVPGAIAENLTSFGGAFEQNGQTKLTEFLEAGAVMSSGSVAEPYSLQVKFPTPMMYGYYAKGLSAIEAYYQSVMSPYQLLIVGDPLAQPFSKAPNELVDIRLLTDGKKRLRLSRKSLQINVPNTPTRSIEISIDGRLFRTTPPVPNIELNLPEDSSGVMEVRATLAGANRTEPRVSFSEQVDIQGKHPTPTAEIKTARTDDGGDGTAASAIDLELICPGADRIEVHHLNEVLGQIDGDQGMLEIQTERLGGGPLRLRPVAFFGDTRVLGKTAVDQGHSPAVEP